MGLNAAYPQKPVWAAVAVCVALSTLQWKKQWKVNKGSVILPCQSSSFTASSLGEKSNNNLKAEGKELSCFLPSPNSAIFIYSFPQEAKFLEC